MYIITPILLMVLPSLWVRFFVLHPNISFSSKKRAFFLSPLYLGLGVLLDVFIVGQYLAVFYLLTYVIKSGVAMTLFMGFLGAVQGIVIFDGFLLKKTGMRLEVGYLRLAKDVKCFWDSGKERGFFLFMPLIAAALLCQSFSLAYLMPSPIYPLHFLAIFCGLGGLALLVVACVPSRHHYHLLPIGLIHERWFLRKLFRHTDGKKSPFDNREVFGSRTQVAETVSEKYPLLKLTKGFSGRRAVDIDVSDKPNVVLIFLESFRAKNLGCMGCDLGLTPNFDHLAQNGVFYKNFYSNSVKTSRCTLASLFGVPSDVDGSGLTRHIDYPLISLADLMKQAGYYTGYMHNGALKFEGQRAFFKRHGYQTVIGKDEIVRHCPNAPETSWGVHDEYMMRYGLHWIDRVAPTDRPLFLTLFTITNHHPWKLPTGLMDQPRLNHKTAFERYRQTYQYTDSCLGLLTEGMKAIGKHRNTLYVILGDHGHPMGEHRKNFNQQRGLFDEQIHVPLLIYGEGRTAGQVIETPASQLDLIPTFMDLFNLETINHNMGSSLLRESDERMIFFHNPYMHQFFGARKGDYKCIYLKSLGEVKLYNLEKDPNERTNIASQHPELVQEFLKNLSDYEKGMQLCYEKSCIAPPKAPLIIASGDDIAARIRIF